MFNIKPSLGCETVSSSSRFYTVLGLNPTLFLLALLLCGSTLANSTSGTIYNVNSTSAPPHNYVVNAYVCAYGSPLVCAYTDSNGAYTLTGLGSGAYSVCVDKVGDDNGAITSADVTRVTAHVTSSNPFSNNNLKWAADVNGSLTVTSTDAALISNWISPHTSFGDTGNWRFWQAGTSTPWPSSDASVCQEFDSMPTESVENDFNAILKGEVTGDWVSQ